MSQTTKGARKMARAKLAKDPDYFRNLGKKNKGVSKAIRPYFGRLKDEDPALHKLISARNLPPVPVVIVPHYPTLAEQIADD